MKHILVPIDFSDDSLNALEYAIMLANYKGYGIRLIYVKRKNADYNASFSLKDFDEVLKSGIEDRFEKIVSDYSKSLKKTFDYKIREGRVYNEICNQAKYGDAEMVVMGTHGVNGFEEKWRGSNAFRVVSKACCPVLTVRYSFPKRPIDKIVLPIDISKETRLKVPYLVTLAKLFKAELHVVDVRENNRISTRRTLSEYMSQIMNYLEAHKIKCTKESLKGTNLANSVIEYAILNDVDLIGIVTETSSAARHFWMGDYTQQMVNHSPIPVLSINTRND